jgi:hypothetical protein
MRRITWFTSICIALSLLGPAGATAAPAPTPSWSLSLTTFPTNFVPKSSYSAIGKAGPAYLLVATNVGAERTAGTFTVTDTLPSGVSASTVEVPFGEFGDQKLQANNTLACSTVGQVVTCTGGPPGVGPGQKVEIIVPLKLASSTSPTVVDDATVSGGGAAPVSASLETQVTAALPEFSFLEGQEGFGQIATEADGSVDTSAGSHPYQLTTKLHFPTSPAGTGRPIVNAAGGGVRDVSVTLPEGMVVNPQATTHCAEAVLESGPGACPAESQVGVVRAYTAASSAESAVAIPLYNVVAPPGQAAEFGFEIVEGVYVHLGGRVKTDGRYQLVADTNDIPAKVTVAGADVVLWGDPSDATHDAQRGACITKGGMVEETTCPVPRTDTALLTLPSACSNALTVSGEADSWEAPTVAVGRLAYLAGIQGCEQLPFEPTITIDPQTRVADSPSGLAVDIRVPQDERFRDEVTGEPVLAEANLKDVNVTLPAGLVVNPSAANGRTACSEGQMGYDPGSATYSDAPGACPDAAKIGSVEIETPLLDHPLPGGVYLAQPYENPFGSLLAIYLAVYDPQTGVVIKLGGHVEADEHTGRLTATFDENPQLPFDDLRLTFFDGARGVLRTPETCGTFASSSSLAPWSGTAPVGSESSFEISGSPAGGCPSTPAQMPNSPSFSAGTVNPSAGSYSPFVLHLERGDGTQKFGALSVSLPPGLTGKLAGVPYCPEGAIAGASSRSGRDEQSSPSCPAASEVGTVTVSAGAGSLPYFVTGKAYLAGPYKGDPLSLAIITPAVAGPFDLGTVVVRAALHVDLETAQISVKSDPLPTILKGIPLDLRSIAVDIGRPQFTLNPTSCNPMALGGEAISVNGQAAPLSNRFQVGGCNGLKFKPKIAIRLKGLTRRAGHPSLSATVTMPKSGANSNIARAQVGLPHSEFLDQGSIGTVCTQAQLKSSSCPKASIYGHAKAWTPLLDKPLEGPIYLGVGYGHKLPDLVADLNGQIRILLHGRIDTTKKHGIRNTFEVVPDAPVSRFELTLRGGPKKGLIENSENICLKPQRAAARFVAQNGKVVQLRPSIANDCKVNGKRKGDSSKGGRAKHRKQHHRGR